MVRALARMDRHVRLSVTYTARDDPNGLLGRPSGYVSKTAFVDVRVDQSQFTRADRGAVDPGGSVEFFATPNLAMTRARYLASLGGNGGFGTTEYDYVDGGALLRVSYNVVPSVAASYKRHLAVIMGSPASGPVKA